MYTSNKGKVGSGIWELGFGEKVTVSVYVQVGAVFITAQSQF